MYATTTCNHHSMPEELTITHSWNGIAVHFDDLYLSFKPEEAARLGEALMRASFAHDSIMREREASNV